MAVGRPAPRRVFLSCTSELARFPAGRSFVEAAKSAAIRAGDAVEHMEYFAAEDNPTEDTCREAVQTSDVYVLIAGFRYGSLVPGGLELSYTELEFDAAAEADLPRLVFLLDEKAAWPAEIRGPQPDARQQAFRARLLGNDGETRLTVAFVRSAEELEITLLHSLQHGARPPRGLQRIATVPHPGMLLWAALSPDGRRLATCGLDSMRLWRVDGPVEEHRFKGRSGYLRAAFDPRATVVACGTDNNDVVLMDRKSGDRKAVLRAGTGKSGTDVFVLSLAFSPDGKRLAAGTSENIVTVWDVATGEVVSRWLSRKKGSLRSLPKALVAASGVYGLCFNHEGTRVAAGDCDGVISVFQSSDGADIGRMTYGRRISTLCISPSNEFMAIGTHGGRWAIHRLRDGAEVRSGDLANRIHASAFSPSSDLVAFGSSGGALLADVHGTNSGDIRISSLKAVKSVAFTLRGELRLAGVTYQVLRGALSPLERIGVPSMVGPVQVASVRF